MTDTMLALLATVRANPGDKIARMVYAVPQVQRWPCLRRTEGVGGIYSRAM